MPDTINYTAFALVLMRMSGCVFFNPIIGRRNLPNYFKVGMTLLFTLVILSYASPVVPEISSSVGYITALLREFIIGYVIGFIITLFNFVIIFGGEISDLQMGISMSKIYDPQSNVSMSMSATYYNILYMFMFFAASGHITLIRIFLISGDIVAYGGGALSPGVSSAMVSLFCQCTVLAVKLALPIVAIELLVEAGVGILMKAIPQINVFVINIQTKLLIGILMIAVLFTPFANFFDRLVTLMFDTIGNIVQLI